MKPVPAFAQAAPARHIASFGLTARDWHRIAERTRPGAGPSSLDDLDARYRFTLIRCGETAQQSGEVVGVFGGYLVLAWPL